MKTPLLMFVSKSYQKPSQTRGFVLIVVMTLMGLLLLITMGLLTISSVATRSGSQELAMSEARANAKLALIIALGELQKELGPDQRISANSGLYDTSPDTPEADGLKSSSQILGVWESWQNWLNADMLIGDGGSLSIQDTYETGRHEQLFRKWLVSHHDPTTLNNYTAPIDSGFGFDDENSVVLVGEGSLGDLDSTASDQVRGGLLDVIDSGGLAWWIGAENQKASIQNPLRERKSEDEIRAGIDSLSHMDARGIKGFDKLPLDEEMTNRYFSTRTAAVALNANGQDPKTLSPYFHSITPHSRSLLVDVRDGRLKRDLSLLFEKDKLPAPFAKTRSQEPGLRPQSSDLRAFKPKLRQRTLFSWGRMHNFYRMYRKQDNPIPNSRLRSQFKPSVGYRGESPYVTMYLNKNKPHATGTYNDAAYARIPIILKHYANIGLQTRKISSTPERYAYYFNFAPVTVLWNPYNVRLELPNDFLGQTTLFYKNLPMEYKIWVNGEPRGSWQYFSFNRNENTLGGDLQTHFTNGGRSRSPIVFEPGEMLIFSHAEDSAHKWRNAKFEPGYQPQNFDSRKMLIPGLENLQGRPRVSVSLRFSDRLGNNSNHAGSNRGSFAVRYTTVKGSIGANQITDSAEVTDADAHMPAWFGIDWFQPSQASQTVVPDSPRASAPFQYADDEPYAIASIGIAAKSGAQPDYPSHLKWQSDWRCKNWLNASPAFFGTQLLNPTDRNRAQCPYYLHFTELDGGVDISAVSPHIGKNGILGSGVAGADQISFAPVLEIPTRPIASLAGFAGARLLPGWWDESRLTREAMLTASDLTWMIKRMSYHSGVPGVGIGNSFAHPMLEADKVYTYHDVSKCDNRTYSEAFSDYWDHLMLANDALWDGWFLSSIATRDVGGNPSTAASQAESFFKEGKQLDDVRLEPHLTGLNADSVFANVMADDGWEGIAAYLMVKGGFNVNSTSLDAWKALFHGLLGRPFVYQKPDGSIGTIVPGTDQAILSRFHLPTTDLECPDPRSGVFDKNGLSRWSGVRYIEKSQLDRLAEECLKQVKLRGPFLNMSEFVNRRLSNDDLGLRGALQAAIDYDDDSPESSSINYRYKSSEDMIDLSTSSRMGYSNPKAATGSRYTAIPGYVVQSDVLQAFGNSLTVRDDTFRIRSYGETRNKQGDVIARAWCEAIVQRYPEFLDPENSPKDPAIVRDVSGSPSDNENLSDLNKKFGRQLKIVQFRWLGSEEV